MRQVLTLFAMTVIAMTCMVQAQIKGYKWHETATFTGRGFMQSAPFRLWSEEWRVKYNPNGSMPFEMRLVNAENDTMESLVHQLTGASRNGTRSGEGGMQWAYLIIRGVEKNDVPRRWTVNVLQYMDKADEWEFRKWKPVESQLKPYGSWSYGPGEKVWSLEMPTAWGRLTFHQYKEGRLSVEVLKGEQQIAHLITTKPGDSHTWFYNRGVYTIRLSAIDTEWGLDVETFEK